MRSAGNLLGTTRMVHPGVFGSVSTGRSARISAGVRASWPGQNDADAAHRAARRGAGAKSEGRRARSVEMITQRPTTGSFRSSGTGDVHLSPRGAARAPAAWPARPPPARRRRARRRRPRRSAASPPPRRARRSAEDTVRTPSATVRVDASASRRLVPRPMARPSARFRLCVPVAVSTRSPSPASPAKVRAEAPSATPSRAISASPRVTSAARAFSPSARLSDSPAAMAITFFSAPPSSTPSTSRFV